MSVFEEDKFPWLAAEKQFIREVINKGKPVLGICLGRSLLPAHLALGCQNPVKEIGWFPIYGIAANDRSCFSFPPKVDAFHWHGATFDLPAVSTNILPFNHS